jgi:hypothetical protein
VVQLTLRSWSATSPSPALASLPSAAPSPCRNSPLPLPLGHQQGMVVPASGTTGSSLADHNTIGSASHHCLSCLPNTRSSPVILSPAVVGPTPSGGLRAGPSMMLHPASSSKLLSPFAKPFEPVGRTRERSVASSPGFTSGSSTSPGSSAQALPTPSPVDATLKAPRVPAHSVATDLQPVDAALIEEPTLSEALSPELQLAIAFELLHHFDMAEKSRSLSMEEL